ncbi:hypothetical protein [Amycolatopsis magusensis]|uniref:Tryptophan-associated transmembrane protein (Trp_oprn_chp) n=1 Tax=Amycolatopsis magusensis TaxID=882444 RepID=A0ABS4PUS5_9PSEU|nr:hypothetical protein [Amycolatopsis magusensis]MBP2183186.1 hypothetical protein [Amycolatopsis magusensis]
MPNRPTAARSMATKVLAASAAAGLVLAVVGSFLSWFRSGSVNRSSYQLVGLIDRFDLTGNPVVLLALRVWIVVPLLAATAIAMLVLGLTRTGAALTVVLAIFVGTAAGFAAVQGGDEGGPIGVTPLGPVTTTIGTLVAVIGALGAVAVSLRPRGHDGQAQQNRGVS